MPAFTFEKLSSSTPNPTAPITIQGNSPSTSIKQVSAKRSRGLIVKMLDRFALARIRRESDPSSTPRKRPPPD